MSELHNNQTSQKEGEVGPLDPAGGLTVRSNNIMLTLPKHDLCTTSGMSDYHVAPTRALYVIIRQGKVHKKRGKKLTNVSFTFTHTHTV